MKEKAADLSGKGLQLQPHVVVLTDDFNSNRKICYAVVTSNMYFESNSVVEAVDICLKSCFVFGLQYNPAARSSWVFLQKAVYGIHTESDDPSNKVKEKLTDLDI